MKELLKIARGSFSDWRDYRKWDNLDPEIRAMAPALRYSVPNTKYGNALVPWLVRLVKGGHIQPPTPEQQEGSYYDEEYINLRSHHKKLVRAYQKMKEWAEKGDEKKVAEWKAKAQQIDEAIHGSPTSMSGYWDSNGIYRQRGRPNSSYGNDEYRVPGWPDTEDDYGDRRQAHLSDMVGQIIAAQKEQKKRGQEPVNPLQFEKPEQLASLLERLEMERMKNSGKILHDFGNGWTVRQLRYPRDAEYEGRMMDNCIGDYADQLGDIKILSLRDPKNKPHVSWEEEPDYGGGGYRLSQVYGKGNSDPKDMYKAALKEYYESMPIEKRPKGRETESLQNHTQMTDDPFISSEYGEVSIPAYQWGNVIRSAWSTNPGGNVEPGFYPENVQKILEAAKTTGQGDELHDAVARHNVELNEFLTERQQEGEAGQPAYQGVLLSPWAQTLKAFQEARPDWYGEGLGGDIVQHYSAHSEPRPHISAHGKYCECPWGDYRPDWDDEWHYHTNWQDDELPFKPVS